MKKSLVLLLALTLVLSTISFAFAVEPVETVKITEDSNAYLQIANEEKLVEMLKKGGKISENATYDEIQVALKSFLKGKADMYSTQGELKSREDKRTSALFDKAKSFSLLSGKGKKVGKNLSSIPNVEVDNYNGIVTEDKILAVLINFSDYDGNTLTSEYTDMYYDEYVKEHYEDLLFGDSYEGPNGETFISMKSYYEQQSGGSYTVSGEVAGWYTASKPAAFYGGNDTNDNDSAPQELVKEALLAVAADSSINLNDFDIEDRYDLDGDGDLREPDGLIDHVMIFHASVGEEAGGGELAEDAIWSHRWNLGAELVLPGTTTSIQEYGGQLAVYDYTIQPIDAAAGVCAHEYGHDLGLPDEYDTQYTGDGEPISYWSIMSGGSWAGKIGGTQPTGFSPYAKEFFAANINPRWFEATEISLGDLDKGSVQIKLDEAATKGKNLDGVKITLPNKVKTVTNSPNGDEMYYSTSDNNLDVTIEKVVDLTNASNATLKFNTYYEIEEDWDYGYVKVIDKNEVEYFVEGNISTISDPNAQNPGFGITGDSNGWVNAEYDLSDYIGQEITVIIGYLTDGAAIENGFYIDEISVDIDDVQLFLDTEESEFVKDGFILSTGTVETSHYYLIEWRNHSGVDEGLANLVRGNSLMSFDPGMVVWYVDNSFDNNHVGNHPGQGFLGVVDSSPNLLRWPSDGVATTKYQMHDAAFSLKNSEKMYLDYTSMYGNNMFMVDNQVSANPLFSDGSKYIYSAQPDSGKILPIYGLNIRVIGESDDQSVGVIEIFK